jgi:NAD(P)-dependent dehydrogenase (short-subunit alcohol dehydrogenase family)
MMMKNKICLVTGGSRGIGNGIVKQLSAKGYKVAFTFNEKEKLAQDLESQLNKNGGNVKSFQMSIENRESVVLTLEKIKKYFQSTVSILINNAAISQEKPFNTITDRDWELMLKVNLQGPFICLQEALPDMIKNQWGRIINITSIGGQWGGYNQVHYAASKASLINLTQSIAKIYSKEGITSNAVAIGLANTDMSGAELDSVEGKKKVENIPIGRIGTIEEIANVVEFLCSDGSTYITGQTINVNGGMYFG